MLNDLLLSSLPFSSQFWYIPSACAVLGPQKCHTCQIIHARAEVEKINVRMKQYIFVGQLVLNHVVKI